MILIQPKRREESMIIWKVALDKHHAGILHAILLPSVAESERFAVLVVVAVVGGRGRGVGCGRREVHCEVRGWVFTERWCWWCSSMCHHVRGGIVVTAPQVRQYRSRAE